MSTTILGQVIRRAGLADRLLLAACVLLFAFCAVGLVVVCIDRSDSLWWVTALTFLFSGGACVFNAMSVWERNR